jgi:predicted DNA-binding transcriptional regulator YafY
MSSSTSQVLELLELLQERSLVSGPELARRFEIDLRTVRRHVARLEELGIPVESVRGRAGGYRLRPGWKLPPLMLDDDEAVAIVLGLVAARRAGLATGAAGSGAAGSGTGGSGTGGSGTAGSGTAGTAGSGAAGTAGSGADGADGADGAAGDTGARDEPGLDRALAKLRRVLPETLRDRVGALEAALGFTRAGPAAPAAPQTATVLALADAIGRARRVEVGYATREGDRSIRQLDPYGLVFHNGRWYLSAHDHGRGELRALRLDRVASVRLLRRDATPPPGFDPVAHVTGTLARVPWRWQVEVVLDAPLDELRRQLPAHAAELEPLPEGGVLLRARAERLDGMARLLAGLGAPFTVRTPDELRTELRTVAQRLTSAASGPVRGS